MRVSLRRTNPLSNNEIQAQKKQPSDPGSASSVPQDRVNVHPHNGQLAVGGQKDNHELQRIGMKKEKKPSTVLQDSELKSQPVESTGVESTGNEVAVISDS